MRPLYEYPDSFGAHRAAVFPHAGPASYEQLDATSPAALPASGGDTVEGNECGMKQLEFVTGGFSDTGTYFVRAIPRQPSNNPAGASVSTYGLIWYVTATGAQVAAELDLSDEVVRLFALGVK